MESQIKADLYICDCTNLPENFPTQLHAPEFWEALGRCVGAFGFLEHTLGKAIFALTATRKFPVNEIEQEYKKWLPTLERALSDTLGQLIDSFAVSARKNTEITLSSDELDNLINKLKEVAIYRNVICHSSWNSRPDDKGRSFPLYVDKKRGVFESSVDVPTLKQIRIHIAELACHIMNTVTLTGYQFPGSNGPGKPIYKP